MKLYSIDVKLTGYETIVVDASSKEEAHEKALEHFWKIYDTTPAASLRTKSTTTTVLDKWKVPEK